MTRRRLPLWSPAALAASLHLAFLVGLCDAGNDNGQPRDRLSTLRTRQR